MFFDKLTPAIWMGIPSVVRKKLIDHFSIPRSEGSVVVANKAASDGHTEQDLEVVTKEGLAELLGKSADTSLLILLEELTQKILDEEKAAEEARKESVASANVGSSSIGENPAGTTKDGSDGTSPETVQLPSEGSELSTPSDSGSPSSPDGDKPSVGKTPEKTTGKGTGDKAKGGRKPAKGGKTV